VRLEFGQYDAQRLPVLGQRLPVLSEDLALLKLGVSQCLENLPLPAERCGQVGDIPVDQREQVSGPAGLRL